MTAETPTHRTDTMLREQFQNHPGWVTHPLAELAHDLEYKLHSTQQALATVTKQLGEARKQADAYFELIFAVATKYDGESRHDTTLRYIRQAEAKESGPAQDALRATGTADGKENSP